MRQAQAADMSVDDRYIIRGGSRARSGCAMHPTTGALCDRIGICPA
jgi:hypothetical protein